MLARYDAVLFDLLSALIDSQALWNRVAGSAATGRNWRRAYLRLTYGAARYRAYQTLIAEAAVEAGLAPRLADDLAAGYAALDPWPEAPGVLCTLGKAVPLAIVTNCSEELGRIAAARTGGAFAAIVTAERAGFYKPHPRPYEIALDALGAAPGRCLFVAGSPYDLFGTARLSVPSYWHDRIGLAAPPDTPAPVWRESTLTPLVGIVGATPYDSPSD